jgi:hypothetical protein
LVAGPSGAGKTTFISLLASRALPSDLLGRLPPDAPDWPQVIPNALRARTLSFGPTDRLIVHYDFAGWALRWESAFDADPVLKFVARATRATVVDIRPSRRALISQHQERAKAKAARRRRWRHWCRLIRRWTTKPSKMLRRLRLPNKEPFYEREGWLENLYANWDKFLESRLSGAEVLRIEPAASETSSRTFRIIG